MADAQSLRGKDDKLVKCRGTACDGVPDHKFAVYTNQQPNATEKCMCHTSEEGDCNCKGCTDKQHINMCQELLGECKCARSESAICDCHGYCHHNDNRKDACYNEPGCEWIKSG